MKKDELLMAQQDGEVVIESNEACPLCGQYVLIKHPETWDKTELRELAAETCTCNGSQNYTARKKKIENLDKCLNRFFGEDSGREVETDTVETIHSLAIQVIDDKIGSASLTLMPSSPDKPIEKLSLTIKKSQLVITIDKKIGESVLV